ncbi:MAG: hypothetical protein ACR2PR_07830 [Pseudohongiellaceae bacterium]
MVKHTHPHYVRQFASLAFAIAVTTVVTATVVAIGFHAPVALAGDEPREPPRARTAGTLSEPVMRAITDIQEMMQPEDEDDEPDLAGAKAELDELYERRYERMNDFEKSTILNFYSNYYLMSENYPEAIRIFERILLIENLRPDFRLRTLRSLGQLQAAQENWGESIRYYQQWRDESEEEDEVVYRGLSGAYYQQDNLDEALPYWIDYMELSLDNGLTLDRNDYAYLIGIYFTWEEYDKALPVTRSMITLFDDPRDWRNLSGLYANNEDDDRRLGILNMAYMKGYFDDEDGEQLYLNLGQSLMGAEVAYSGAKVIQRGLENNYIEANVKNLTTLSQMYQVAGMFERAIPPTERATELDETGDSYDTLGYLHYLTHDFEASAEAFEDAIDKGDLSNEADTLVFYSRALVELERFDDAREATEQARDMAVDEDDGRGIEAADNYLDFIGKVEQRKSLLDAKKAEYIDHYQSYPPLRMD